RRDGGRLAAATWLASGGPCASSRLGSIRLGILLACTFIVEVFAARSKRSGGHFLGFSSADSPCPPGGFGEQERRVGLCGTIPRSPAPDWKTHGGERDGRASRRLNPAG